MNALSFELKKAQPVMGCDTGRLDVLITLVLHSNVRNRCWPKMELIAKLATGGNLTKATAAKRWLIDHGAIELVAYKHRLDDEQQLPKRQHVYQLTGILKACKEGCDDCRSWNGEDIHYLYIQTPEILDSIISPPEIIQAGGLSITNSEVIPEKDSAPDGASPQELPIEKKKEKPRNAMYDAILTIWGYTASRNGKLAKMLQGVSTDKGYVEFNVTPGITAEELLKWHDWHVRRHAGQRMIEKLINIQSSIGEYRFSQSRQNNDIPVLDYVPLFPDEIPSVQFTNGNGY